MPENQENITKEPTPKIEGIYDELSELMKKYGIENHILCIETNNNVLLHYSDTYESARLIKRGHDIIKEKIMKEVC